MCLAKFYAKLIGMKFFLFFAALIIFLPSAEAQLPASCDADFHEVLKARAELEARREMEVAQRLILRPDSVLEYSCFGKRVSQLGDAADELFSDNISSTALFNDPPSEYEPAGAFPQLLPTMTIDDPNTQPNEGQVTPPNTGQDAIRLGPNPPGEAEIHGDRLGNVLGVVVTGPTNEYLITNFGHLYAGGTLAVLPPTPANICDPMQLVWDFLRCGQADSQLFQSFDSFADFDYRINALPCNDPNRKAELEALVAAASPAPGALGGIEPVETQLAQFDSNACSSIQPITTGLQVYGESPPQVMYEDAFCPAAGCYYDGENCVP